MGPAQAVELLARRAERDFTMKTVSTVRTRRGGFTLVEMIGVLAIVAILSSLLVPRVFQAISDAKVNNAASRCTTTKAAVANYYGRYARIAGTNGSDLGISGTPGTIYEDWDLKCLVTEGYLDQPLAVGVGNGLMGASAGGSRVHVVNIAGNDANSRPASGTTDIDKGAYNLDGNNATNDVVGHVLVEACIEGVDNQDAVDLSRRIDGAALSVPIGSNDEVGHVKYYLGTNGVARVRVYLAHY